MSTESIIDSALIRQSSRGRLRYHQSTLSIVHRIADAFIILASLYLAREWTGLPWSSSLALTGVIGVLVFYFLASAKNLYRSWRTESMATEVWYTIESWLGVTAVSLVALYMQRDALSYPPETIVYWLFGTPVLLAAARIGVRFALRWARAHGYNTRRLAIAGNSDLGQHIARWANENHWLGFRMVGMFDDTASHATHATSGATAPASLDRMVELACRGDVDVVYITLPPDQAEQQIESLIRKLGDSTSSVYLVQDRRSRNVDGATTSLQSMPDIGRVDALHRRCVNLDGIKAVSVYESPFHGPDAMIKRVEDLVVGTVAVLLLAVPMVFIAAGVKMSGPGPVLFKQRRFGLDGKEIMVWKFRSMTVCEDHGSVTQARKGDLRVTPFGGFLRRTSLDELPQFFNVLQGSMSIVGPRPHAVAHNQYYRGLIGGYMLRHKVKPGITGWAQVNGWRGETDSLHKMGKRVDYDLDYIRNWTLWLDIQIILATFIHGFVHKNAY
jgi:putative colanic acid biosysnthesis UDP-glucose lipid carrier transferase